MADTRTRGSGAAGATAVRRRMRGLVLLLGLVMFSMVGCIRYELAFTVNEDGSGTMGLLAALSDQFNAMMGTTTEEALGFDEAALPPGNVEEYREDGYSGIQISAPFANLEQLAFLMGTEQADSLTDDFVLRPDGSGGWQFSAALVPASESAGGAAPAAEQLPPDLLEGSWARVRVQLPGEVGEHNADRIENGVFVWELDLASPDPRDLIANTTAAATGAEEPQSPDTGHGVLAGAEPGTSSLGVIALGVVALLTAAGGVATRRRMRA